MSPFFFLVSAGENTTEDRVYLTHPNCTARSQGFPYKYKDLFFLIACRFFAFYETASIPISSDFWCQTLWAKCIHHLYIHKFLGFYAQCYIFYFQASPDVFNGCNNDNKYLIQSPVYSINIFLSNGFLKHICFENLKLTYFSTCFMPMVFSIPYVLC